MQSTNITQNFIIADNTKSPSGLFCNAAVASSKPGQMQRTENKIYGGCSMKKIRMTRIADNKIFEISKTYSGKYAILENRGLCGCFDAVLFDIGLIWNTIEPFESLAQAYLFLKNNINNLL